MKKLTVIFIVVTALLWSQGLLYSATQVNGLTVDNLYTSFQRDVNDTSERFVTGAEFIEYIDEAQKIVASFCRCLEAASEDVAVVSGTRVYTPDTAHYDVEGILYEYDDSSLGYDQPKIYGMTQIDLQDIASYPAELGRPQYWYEWKGTIGLHPVPYVNNSTMTVFMISTPTEITATTDALQTPYYYNTVLLMYAQAKYHEKKRDENRATYYRNMFTQYIETYRSATRRPRAK